MLQTSDKSASPWKYRHICLCKTPWQGDFFLYLVHSCIFVFKMENLETLMYKEICRFSILKAQHHSAQNYSFIQFCKIEYSQWPTLFITKKTYFLVCLFCFLFCFLILIILTSYKQPCCVWNVWCLFLFWRLWYISGFTLWSFHFVPYLP